MYCNAKNLQTEIIMITCRYNVLYSACGTQLSGEVRGWFALFTQILLLSYSYNQFSIICRACRIPPHKMQELRLGTCTLKVEIERTSRNHLSFFMSPFKLSSGFPFFFCTSHTMQQTQKEDSWYSGSRYQS